MSKTTHIQVIPEADIVNKIYHIRGCKVMLDSDLAELYQVETRVLNQAIKRNENRFPEDFMFQLSSDEWENLKSQFVISRWGGRRILPYVFTEQGVAMLSSVLNSEMAINVNIRIIRVFTKMREVIMTNKDILLRKEKVEKELAAQGGDIDTVFYYLDQFIKYHDRPKEPIGFAQKHNK
jgi:ORF6N domain